jgi:hypothetical protein
MPARPAGLRLPLAARFTEKREISQLRDEMSFFSFFWLDLCPVLASERLFPM